MIFVDSLYINNSGGLQLLKYFVSELQTRKISFFLLADSRCQGVFDKCNNVTYMKASLWERNNFYQNNKGRFSSVLCFGNVPPLVKLDVPVYTFFHNINLLTLAETQSTTNKAVSWLKRAVFKLNKKNTDYWLVQTSNTAKELVSRLGESSERVLLMPFFELPGELSDLNNVEHGEDYVFISNYTGAKGHEELLDAWKILHNRGLNRVLHLTVPFKCKSFCKKVMAAQEAGVKVENHGFVGYEEVMKLYRKSKAIIYPSHNESLGLGIIEAITAGCDVIGSDLPFIHAVCKPSMVFNPYSAESIANSVIEYEHNNTPKSELLIENKISELVKLLLP